VRKDKLSKRLEIVVTPETRLDIRTIEEVEHQSMGVIVRELITKGVKSYFKKHKLSRVTVKEPIELKE